MRSRSMLPRTPVRGMRGGATARRRQHRAEARLSPAHLVRAKLRALNVACPHDSNQVVHDVLASGTGKVCGKSA